MDDCRGDGGSVEKRGEEMREDDVRREEGRGWRREAEGKMEVEGKIRELWKL